MNQNIKNLLSHACLLALVGCASTAKFNANSDFPLKAKPLNCSYKVANTFPKDEYVEIGIVDIHAGGGATGNLPKTIEKFKEVVGSEVCQAGGDLVVGEINGFGGYVRGTVFVKKSQK